MPIELHASLMGSTTGFQKEAKSYFPTVNSSLLWKYVDISTKTPATEWDTVTRWLENQACCVARLSFHLRKVCLLAMFSMGMTKVIIRGTLCTFL